MLKWIAALAVMGATGAMAAPAASSATVPTVPPPVVTRAAPPAPPAPIRVLPPVTPERRKLAAQAVGLALSDQMMIEAVLGGWERGQASAKEDMAALEEVSPGLSGKIIDRGKSELLALLNERIPGLRASMTDIYAGSMTEDELRTTITFFQSATGQQFIRKMLMSETGDNMADDLEVTSSEMMKANRAAARETVETLSTPQKADLVRFGFSPAGRAMRVVGAKVQPVAAQWVTSVMADYQQRVGPIIEKIVTDALDARK